MSLMNVSRRVRFFFIAYMALAALIALAQTLPAAAAPPSTDPLQRPALQAPRALHGVMLAAACAGPRLVAAGERGIVLWSDDGGQAWHQADVPVSVTLTGLSFPTPDQGWAVGHGGVVLHTADGGQHWTRQLDGRAAAALERQASEASGDAKRIALAEQLVRDGPDKPLLAVHFWDKSHGFAIGAYGLIIGTDDGGLTWASWSDRVDNPKGLHLNALYVSPTAIFVAGEQGLLLRSQDNGKSFQRLESPYKGSWFAVAGRGDTVVLGGLRGNVFWSTDAGADWTASQVPVPVTIGAALATPSGFVFTNQAGQLLSSSDGRSLSVVPRPAGPPLTALALATDGGLLAASFAGALRLSAPTP